MQLIAVGLNHHTAPVAVREQVAFTSETVAEALRDLVDHRAAHEAAIVSTCNRTELYCGAGEPEQAARWLAEYHHLKQSAIAPYLYTLDTRQAVQHAFRVASGLDSMVVGEPQILGQMKDAVRLAERAGTLGTVLHKLFQRAFSVAKEVRTRTEIGASSVSMAAAAVRLAQQIFDDLSGQRVLFIGAGEMIELCAAHFAAHKPAAITVANRTLERGRALATRHGAASITLNELPEHLHQHDIVITSTASPLPILGKGLVERAIRARRHRPMFMVDLAVPRDVEAEVGELDDVFLYGVDDLADLVQQGFETRRGAMTEAESIIDANVERFMHWIEGREVVPTIRALRDHAERQRRHEVERALRLLARGEPPEKVLEALSHGITNKLLHSPSHALNHADGEERRQLAALLARLYQIHNPE